MISDFQIQFFPGEKGAAFPLHWDDRRNTLPIGDRAGTFEGLKSKHAIGVVVVTRGHGIGIGTESGVDRTVKYPGIPHPVMQDYRMLLQVLDDLAGLCG